MPKEVERISDMTKSPQDLLEIEQLRRLLYQSREECKKLRIALEWARPILNELCELYMDEIWGEINKDTEYELMKMKNFANPVDVALTHPG